MNGVLRLCLYSIVHGLGVVCGGALMVFKCVNGMLRMRLYLVVHGCV